MMMEMILEGGHVSLDDLDDLLRKDLSRSLSGADVINIVELVDAFQGTKIPPELISKIMLLQKAIESDIASPELSSQDLANKLRRPNVNPETLVPDLLELLKKNGLSIDSLEKSMLLQKATALSGVNQKEFSKILDLQNKMQEAGRTPEEIATAIKELIAKSGLDVKTFAQNLINALDQGKIKGEEVTASSYIFDAIMKNGSESKHEGCAIILKDLRGNPSQNDVTNVLRKAIEASKIHNEDILKVLLLQKILAATESIPSDLAKVVRIENAIVKSGVAAESLAKVINEAVKPRNKSILEKMRRPLQDIINGAQLNFAGQEVKFTQDYQEGIKSNIQADENKLKEVFDNAMKVVGISKEDLAKALLVQKTLAASGVTPEIMAQVVMFQKALAASGISPAEIADIFNRAIAEGLSDEALSELIKSSLEKKGCGKDEIEKIIKLQKSLGSGVIGGAGEKLNGGFAELLASGKVDASLLQKALMMQKILAASGLSAEDLGKAFLLQNSLIEAGASYENVANCMHRSLIESGMSLEHLITMMEIELKAALAKGITPNDVVKLLHLEKIIGAATTAKRIMRKINPEALRLIEATVQKQVPGKPGASLMEAMKGALGSVLDQSMMQAMEVQAAMMGAGASKEEIEEMMQMILNKGGGISSEFIEAIKEAMTSGGSPFDKLNALKAAMEEEMNSVTNALRNTFLNRVPTTEEIANSCKALAEKLCADAAARTDVKLALVDVLDEALQGLYFTRIISSSDAAVNIDHDTILSTVKTNLL